MIGNPVKLGPFRLDLTRRELRRDDVPVRLSSRAIDILCLLAAANGDVVGSTRYFNVDPLNRRLEIGHTWYAKRAQRTAINTECKLLLLTHAFETLGCIAVEFRTHWFNHASRAAIARLGAKQDGVLRNHQLLPDGSKRDTVVFSIIDAEWVSVKRHLTFLLEQPRSC